MSDESHLSVAECSGNASTDPFPAGHSNLSASLDIISASLEAAEREKEEGAQRENIVTEWICPDGRRTWSVVRKKVTIAEGSQFKEGDYHLVIIWLSHLAHDHPDSLCLGLFGRVGGADSLVSGRFLAILGENVCSTKWKQGTLAQSNFRRMANAMPISRMVEWVDSVTFPLQPPFTSGDDTHLRVQTAVEFAKAVEDLLESFPSNKVLVDSLTGRMLLEQDGYSVFFASEGPPLLGCKGHGKNRPKTVDEARKQKSQADKNYEYLTKNSAPKADFDCKSLLSAERLLEIVAKAATQHPAASAAVTSINISRNSLQPYHMPSLQEHMRKFSSLQKLDISFNPALECKGVVAILTSLSEAQTAKIEFLNISCTGIEIGDVDFITYHVLKFSSLKVLDISSNLSLDTEAVNRMVATFAGKCVGDNLHSLNLSGTSIEKLPDDLMKCLPKLKSLKLNDCRALVFLPLSLAALEELEVADCSSLVYPPSSARQTPERVLQFLRDVDPTSEPWRRLKIVFLGNGRSGKTSLLGTLAKRDLNPYEKSTRGVEIDRDGLNQKTSMLSKRKMGFPDMELSWWDFAGQLEYSAAHQFFLSSRQALYVVVFSVQEDNESIMQQLFYWLSVIPDPQAHVVRILIVGTKIDLLPRSELKDTLRMKRGVIQQVIDAKGLTNKVSQADVVFATASNFFKATNPTESEKDWHTCRRSLKNRIYHHIQDIFSLEADIKDCKNGLERQRKKEEFDRMRYPKDCKSMSDKVKELCQYLSENKQLPCLKLDNEHAIRLLGSLWRGRDQEQCKNYFKTAMGMRALEVCHDLGIVSLYGRHNPIPSVCVEPSFTTKIISLLVDPQTDFPAITTVEHLEEVLLKHSDITRIYKDSKKEDKNRQKAELIDLLVSLGLVRRYEDSQKILVPLALRGRPDCWSKILKIDHVSNGEDGDRHKSERRESALFLGLRLGVNPAVSVPAAAFIQLMLDKCEDADRMWGCAFAYEARGYATGWNAVGPNPSVVFVRLSEDRRSVDIVAVFDADSDGYSIVQSEIESIATILGDGFNSQRDRMPLCPMCCCTDFFVRSGNVHAFHFQEVAAGGALICTRHHNVTATDCLHGKFTIIEVDALPFVYPTKMHTIRLPWKCVSEGGVIGTLEHEADDALAVHATLSATSAASVQLNSDEVVANAVSESDCAVPSADIPVSVGDIIAAEYRPLFSRHMRLCVSEDCSCTIILTSGASKTLRFSFNVGDTIPNPFVTGLTIQNILPTDIGDRVLDPEAPRLQRFCAQDNVLVVFGPIQPKTKFLVFPGTKSSLNLVRITPALCKIDSVAAVCWAEMQDQFHVVMGREFEMYDVEAITLFRNDPRISSFNQILQELQGRAQTLEKKPHWILSPDDVASKLTSELDFCKLPLLKKFAEDLIDGEKLATMQEEELLRTCESILETSNSGTGRKQDKRLELYSELMQVKETCEMQHATMRHFEEFVTKFSILPPTKNVDVNLTVAWWGSSRGSAVYMPVAQNGFINIPTRLKIDSGFYGNGFYFTRYPRYSDYYVSGCKQASNSGDDGGSFLMSFVACGRPYPVTQRPGSSDSLEGIPCNAESPCHGGPGRHDSHYVCVKYNGEYYPCPAREQPDFDEIVAFHSNAVLPVAAFEFKRRRRTLLWLDDRPHNNILTLQSFPGCPDPAELRTPVYPMREHCLLCKHGLTMDSNPKATLKEREKVAAALELERDKVLNAARKGDPDAQARLPIAIESLRQAEALVAAAAAAAKAVQGDHAGRDIKMEDQTDVVLLTCVADMTQFLRAHPELSNFPSSLLRIVSNYELMHEAGGLLDFLDTDPQWLHKYPATMLYYRDEHADVARFRSRPSSYSSMKRQVVDAFATFKSLALQPRDIHM